MTDVTHKDIENGASLWRDAWLRLRKNRLAMASLAYLLFIFVVCGVGPVLTPYGYDEPSEIFQAEAPGAQHWFGTDILGRDLFTRILYGGRISLAVGFAATGVALLIGVFYGAIAGFASGRTDSIMMRLVDILYTMPFTMVVIILMVYLGQSLLLIFLAIGAVEWLTMARIVRSQV
ncbi:MAG: ABC transporter permease, partial [Anaerolineae bacterium]|nr:ABC transporter permease [Anaerolineae bacterium]